MADKYVLILFGTNEVAYSAAAALESSFYKTVCFFPKASNNFFESSDKIHVKGRSDFSWNSAPYLQELVSFLKRLRAQERILTFLCHDEAVLFWSKHQAVLSPYCTVLTENIERFYNKILFYDLLQQIAVAYPQTWALSEAGEAKLPFLIKPAFRNFDRETSGNPTAKIKIVRNISDLQKVRLADPVQWLCQEILYFRLGDEYSWWGYQSPKGEIASTVARHKRKFPGRSGRVSNLEIVSHPPIKLMGDSIVKQLGYHGIAEIQFIFDRNTSIFKVTDFNPRLWCGHSALLMNHMNFIKKCADDYYQGQAENVGEKKFYEIESFERKEWFSILDNIHGFDVFKIRCSEFYGRRSDNLKTRVLLLFFLFAKFIYYALTQGLIRK